MIMQVTRVENAVGDDVKIPACATPGRHVVFGDEARATAAAAAVREFRSYMTPIGSSDWVHSAVNFEQNEKRARLEKDSEEAKR